MKQYLFFLVLVVGLSVWAQQEVRIEGAYFPQYYTTFSNPAHSTQKTSSSVLNLPFKDDFSYYVQTPDTNLWKGSSATVGLGYGIKPPTFGVATFNGCNRLGKPYATTVSYGGADTLLSKPIDLSTYTASNNIYLSFFYQPQGLGDAPELKDSLIVEFKSSTNNWVQQWVKKGSALISGQGFKFVALQVNQPTFLHNSFQFRFRNFASLNGDFDHWHIDYVYLNQNRTNTDSTYNDVSIQYPISRSTFYPFSNLTLKEYQQRLKLDTTTFYVSNLNAVDELPSCPGRRIIRYGTVLNTEVPPCLPAGIPALTTQKQSLSAFSNYSIDTTSRESEFREHYFLNQATPDDIPANDSLMIARKVYDFLSYDDGSPESGYGISGPNQGNYAFAYKYQLLADDEITRVRLSFSHHWGTDNSALGFRIRIYASLTPEVILYESPSSLYPNYTNFWTDYTLKGKLGGDTSIVIPSNRTFYVGIKQINGTPLGVASDMNYNANADASNRLFWVNLTGSWEYSTWEGSILLRTYMKSGQALTHLPTQPNKTMNNIILFPNPAQNTLSIKTETLETFGIQILDVTGKCVYMGTSTTLQTIQLPDLENGVYVVQLLHQNQSVTQHKLMIMKP